MNLRVIEMILPYLKLSKLNLLKIDLWNPKNIKNYLLSIETKESN